MKYITLSVFLCGIFIGTSVSRRSQNPELNIIDLMRKEFLELETQLWENVLNPEWNSVSAASGVDVTLIKYYKDFDDKMKLAYNHDVDFGLKQLENVWEWARMYSELRGVYAMYETFRRFQNKQLAKDALPSPKQAWIDIAETILEDSRSSIDQSMDRIQALILNDLLFQKTLKEANSEFCNMQQSPHQLLYNLYNTIALTELKGYAMTQFSYMLLKLYNKGNFTEEAKIMRENYQDRTNRIINIIKKVMASASKDLWNCDPKKYVNGENYLELTGLLQGYIENEVDLNGDGTCRENCAHYVYTRNHGCYKDRYCSKQRKCNGKIISCQYIDSDMWICPANEKSSRRYEYVEYENGRILGRKMNCPRGTTKVDSWWRWLFWHCSYCLCLCDEQGQKSDRYFNMRSVDSNVDKNRVITGLRFTKENRIIHLQIQEGELLPHGNINYDSVNWVPINKYGITDRYIYNGNDYHTLSWEQRAIDLDDLVAPEGHIVTGVRFRKIGTHLNFEIRTTPFNFTTGELINPQEKSVWIGNDNTDGNPRAPRREIKLRSPDVPIRSPSPSAPDSLHDTYLQFVNSDLDKDAAQTTVPFIDSQPVMSQIPVPLSGAGIYHKGQFGFGGFIAPKLITYDYTKHMHSAFPSDEIIH